MGVLLPEDSDSLGRDKCQESGESPSGRSKDNSGRGWQMKCWRARQGGLPRGPSSRGFHFVRNAECATRSKTWWFGGVPAG
jgi:hypothetical protein